MALRGIVEICPECYGNIARLHESSYLEEHPPTAPSCPCIPHPMRTLSLGAIGGDCEAARRRRGAVRGRRVACGGRHRGSSKASGAAAHALHGHGAEEGRAGSSSGLQCRLAKREHMRYTAAQDAVVGAASRARGRRGRMGGGGRSCAAAVRGGGQGQERDKVGHWWTTRARGGRGARGCRTRALSHGRLLLSHYLKFLVKNNGYSSEYPCAPTWARPWLGPRDRDNVITLHHAHG